MTFDDLPSPGPTTAGSYLYMLQGSVAFALMGTMTHALRDTCAWQVIALARTGLALIIAFGLAHAAGVRLVFWKPGTLWLRSIAGSISLVCTFFALTRLPPSEVLTLTNMFPLWVALLSWPMLGEVPTRGVWLAVACGVGGVFLMQQPRVGQGNLAALVALGGSFSTAVAMLGLHRLQYLDARAIVVHFSFVGLLFCGAAFVLFDYGPARPDALALGPGLMLLGVGVTATVGQIFLTRAFASGPPARVAVVGLSQIVFALVLDMIFWEEAPNPLKVGGMGLVLGPTGWLLVQRQPVPGPREAPGSRLDLTAPLPEAAGRS